MTVYLKNIVNPVILIPINRLHTRDFFHIPASVNNINKDDLFMVVGTNYGLTSINKEKVTQNDVIIYNVTQNKLYIIRGNALCNPTHVSFDINIVIKDSFKYIDDNDDRVNSFISVFGKFNDWNYHLYYNKKADHPHQYSLFDYKKEETIYADEHLNRIRLNDMNIGNTFISTKKMFNFEDDIQKYPLYTIPENQNIFVNHKDNRAVINLRSGNAMFLAKENLYTLVDVNLTQFNY